MDPILIQALIALVGGIATAAIAAVIKPDVIDAIAFATKRKKLHSWRSIESGLNKIADDLSDPGLSPDCIIAISVSGAIWC